MGCWWRQGAGLMPGAEKRRAEAAQAPLTGHICTLSSAGKRAMWPSRGPGQELKGVLGRWEARTKAEGETGGQSGLPILPYPSKSPGHNMRAS